MNKRLYKTWLSAKIIARKFYLAEIKFYIDLLNIKLEKRRKQRAITLANELSAANKGQRYFILKDSNGRFYVMDRAEFKMRQKLAFRGGSSQKKKKLNIDYLLTNAVYITPASTAGEIYKEYIRQTKKA